MYQAFDKAPREVAARQLYWTLAGLFFAILLNMQHLPVWVWPIVLCAVIWRGVAFHEQWRMPNLWVRTIIALGLFLLVAANFQGINGLNAGAALLAVMSATKLTETRGRRDCVVLLFIAYFMVLTHFLFEQSFLATLFAVPVVVVITGALLRLSESPTPKPWHVTLKTTGSLLLQATPIMLVLFFLFPRVPGPFWALPQPEGSATTGLSDTMTPGMVSDLAKSDSVAFRVDFISSMPKQEDLYWRGPTLSGFDGRTWRIFETRLPVDFRYKFEGSPIEYEITLEPHEKTWLFALDMVDVESLPPGTSLDQQYLLNTEAPVHQVERFRLRAYTNYFVEPTLTISSRKHYLGHPKNRNQKTQELIEGWRSENLSNTAVVEKALAYFTENDFYYSLQPPKLKSLDSVDEFLFESRKGFCEHYASSFAIMMRMAGIPSRIVTGYQGGELNPLGTHMTVRQANAHAWTEVWLKNVGWMRVDPTAAIAPERVEQSLNEALANSNELPTLVLRDNNFSKSLRFSWDALNNKWNQAVLRFDQKSQLNLLERFGFKNPSYITLVVLLSFGMIIIVGLHYLYSHRRKSKTYPDELAKYYAKICDHLKEAGARKRDHEGPVAFGQRAQRLFPDHATALKKLFIGYANIRYYPLDNQTRLKLEAQWLGEAKRFVGVTLPPPAEVF